MLEIVNQKRKSREKRVGLERVMKVLADILLEKVAQLSEQSKLKE